MSSTAMVGPLRAAIVRAEGRRLPEYLTRDQVHQVLQACKTERDRLLVAVAWRTGARISEILGLERQDVDFANRQLRLRTLKKPKRRDRKPDLRRRPTEEFRWIPVHAELVADLASFVLASKTENGRLFPIGRVRAFEIIRDAARAAGVTAPGARGIHPHTLRHSFAVHCLNQGVPINILKELLGHASILTTMVYLRVVPADLRAFLARVEF